MAVVRHKAAIHSGHFMVSDFEPDEQDEEDAQVDTPTRGPRATRESSVGVGLSTLIATREEAESEALSGLIHAPEIKPPIKISKYQQTIRFSLSATNEKDVPLSKLLKSMSVAYKNRITSPRWNRFRGLKLRWKDKIRMNNVIWRCWHMQFMKNNSRTLCAFANPLEIDNHNKMEGTTLLEGKYWKRKLQTIRQEYSKWRNVYYSQHEDPSGNGNGHIQPASGGGNSVNSYGDFNNDWENYLKSPNHQLVEGTRDDVDLQSMLNEEGIIVDLLLNTFQGSTSANSELSSFLAASSVVSNGHNSITTTSSMSLAVPFQNPRDFYSSTTNADLIQPGLGPLQPNLDEMEIDLDWLNTMNTGQQQPQLQQPQSMASSVHHDQKPDLLSAIVTATTASSFQSVVAPVTYKQEQTILTSVQPQQPLQASIIELQPPVATNNQVEATLVHPRYRGGGKQRSMMALNQQQQQSVMPYPASGYTSGHVTSVSAKTKSPKHRFLQQRHSTYSNNELTNELNPVSSQRSANSELVQLLTSAKTPHATSTPVTDPRGPILTTLMPPVTPAPPSVLDNGRHLVPTPQQPTLLVIGIPPPLPTDYQPDHLATDYRTNGNGTHPDTHPNADHRRSVHTHAEQNRRTSLKHGFEELRSLIPSLKDVSTSSHKISKAALLVKGGDQICHIKSQCQALTSEAVQLKAAIEALEMDVSAIQGGLPGLKLGQDMSNNASEGNISVKLRQKKVSEDQTQMTSAFSNHVSNATGLNWKYWAFSRLMKPVFETYANAVAGAASQGEMDRSINRWLEDECSLDQMRQSAVTSLKSICTQTNVLSDPKRLPHEALELARKSAAMNISLKVEKYTTPN